VVFQLFVPAQPAERQDSPGAAMWCRTVATAKTHTIASDDVFQAMPAPGIVFLAVQEAGEGHRPGM
jgi:hypothetical protein